MECPSICRYIIARSRVPIIYIHVQHKVSLHRMLCPEMKGQQEIEKSDYMSRRNRLYAEMREQMAKTTNAKKDRAMEPFAMLGKGSLPQLSIKSATRAVADDDDDINRYVST